MFLLYCFSCTISFFGENAVSKVLNSFLDLCHLGTQIIHRSSDSVGQGEAHSPAFNELPSGTDAASVHHP